MQCIFQDSLFFYYSMFCKLCCFHTFFPPGSRDFRDSPFRSSYREIPNSSGRNRGHTFSEDVMTEAANLVPISTACASVLP